MIGGNDIVIPAVGDSAALEACLRIVRRHWPHARFEDAITGDKYSLYGDIPLGRVREVIAYPDADAEAAWDADSPDSPPNSMLYLIASPIDRGGFNFEYSLQTINAHWVAEGALVLLMVACWRTIADARAARAPVSPPTAPRAAPAPGRPAAAPPAGAARAPSGGP